MTQNDKKFCLTLYLRNCTSCNCIVWCTCVKWWYLQHFFFFFFFHFIKILIFLVFQSSWINAKRKFWGVSHLLHVCNFFTFQSLTQSWKIKTYFQVTNLKSKNKKKILLVTNLVVNLFLFHFQVITQSGKIKSCTSSY